MPKKIKEFTERLAIRIASEQREMINQLINDGKFKNLSQVIRAALKDFLLEYQ